MTLSVLFMQFQSNGMRRILTLIMAIGFVTMAAQTVIVPEKRDSTTLKRRSPLYPTGCFGGGTTKADSVPQNFILKADTAHHTCDSMIVRTTKKK